MVAVAALLVTGIGLASRVGDSGTGVAAAGATTRYGAPASGMAGLLPAIVPSGWSLASLDVGAEAQVDTAQRWQLFGAGDGPPLDRGVLVGSARQNDRVIDGATHTVHGRPAQVGPPADPSHPAGALTAAWVDAGVVHDVVAVGLGEDELVAFLDGLTPRADPLDGFDAVDAAMPEIGATTVGGVRTTSATYVGPAGPTDQVRVSATSGDGYGGLLHRLDGVAAPGGLVRRGALGGDPSFRFVGQARDDGWSVGVVAIGSVTVAEDAEVLDEFLASLRSATHDDLVALALAQPTTGSFPLGGGRTVEVHGTGVEDVGLCVCARLGPAGVRHGRGPPGWEPRGGVAGGRRPVDARDALRRRGRADDPGRLGRDRARGGGRTSPPGPHPTAGPRCR